MGGGARERNAGRDARQPSFQWARADNEAVDLYHFTSLINRTLDEKGRLAIVEMMWEVVFADGSINEFEDNLMWRTADLLGVSSRDRIALRRRVAGEHADAESDGGER